MRYGRSFVLTIPDYAAKAMNVQKGDVFVVIFDDDQRTVTYKRLFNGEHGPKIEIDGKVAVTQVMV